MSDRQIEAMFDLVQPDARQREIIEVIVNDHRRAFATVADEGRAIERELGAEAQRLRQISLVEAIPTGIQLQKRVAEFADRLRDLDQQLLSDIELLWEETQQGDWQAFLQVKREMDLQTFTSSVPGVRINLSALVNDLQLLEFERPAIDEILVQYHAIRDPLIDAMFDAQIRNARDTWKRSEQVQRMNKKLSGLASLQAYEDQAKRSSKQWLGPHRSMLASQVAVRQANMSFADLIANMLPPEKQQPFRDAFEFAKHPNAHVKTTLAHLYVARVRSKCDLTELQQAVIAHKIEALDSRLMEINRDAAAIQERAFVDTWKHPDDNALHGQRQNEVEQVNERRNSAAWDGIQEIFGALTEEQQKKAPLPEREIAD